MIISEKIQRNKMLTHSIIPYKLAISIQNAKGQMHTITEYIGNYGDFLTLSHFGVIAQLSHGVITTYIAIFVSF